MSTRPIGAEAPARVTGDRQTSMHGEGFARFRVRNGLLTRSAANARIQIRRIVERNWASNRDAGFQSHHSSAHRAGQR